MKLLILCRFILLITALIGVFGKKRKTGEKKVVKLGRAEYCWGCQYTVQAMANLTETYFRKVQDLGEQPTAQASEIAERMCDSKYFDRFLPFIRYSCMKILDDHSADFLLQFEGHVKMIRAKNIMYERITSFCGEGIHACPTALPFDKKNSKTQCDACRVLAVDAESAYKTILGKPTQVIENVCRTLGYYHQPYVWLEEYCDEMMEDYSDKIVKLLKQRETETRKEPVGDVMCKELFQCPKAKKNINPYVGSGYDEDNGDEYDDYYDDDL